ncbi:MAG: thiamine phosphate synthase [Dehalococcoidia bacterium]
MTAGGHTLAPPPGLQRPCLMLVTDRELAGGEDALVRCVSAAVAGGVTAVQLREKDLPNERLLALATRIQAAIAGRAILLINERPAVALAAGAGGVHGGEASLPVSAMRRAVRGRLLVGRSVHSLSGAVQAAGAGADYLVLGTIFPSRSHPGGETGGLELVRSVCAAVNVPVIAIGGITAENARDVMEAGAAGIAVISAIIGRPDPRFEAERLRSALEPAGREAAWSR